MEVLKPALPIELVRPSLEEALPMGLDENTLGPDADEDRLMFEPDPGTIFRFGSELITL
jgi:hypothetical protein